ncbi:MAG: DUF6616 family protein [Bacteroidota bacterium]
MENNNYLLTEIWKPRASWLSLGEDERQNYLSEKMGPLLMQMMNKGAELLGAAINENATAEKIDYVYKAVWKLPSKEISEELEKGAKEVGFYEYFEQVNFSGKPIGPEELIGHMIKF